MAYVNVVKREWLQSEDPDDWLFTLFLLKVEDQFPGCNRLQKGIYELSKSDKPFTLEKSCFVQSREIFMRCSFVYQNGK